MHIPFNKPYITSKEVHYIYDAVATGKIIGHLKQEQQHEKTRCIHFRTKRINHVSN